MPQLGILKEDKHECGKKLNNTDWGEKISLKHWDSETGIKKTVIQKLWISKHWDLIHLNVMMQTSQGVWILHWSIFSCQHWSKVDHQTIYLHEIIQTVLTKYAIHSYSGMNWRSCFTVWHQFRMTQIYKS